MTIELAFVGIYIDFSEMRDGSMINCGILECRFFLIAGFCLLKLLAFYFSMIFLGKALIFLVGGIGVFVLFIDSAIACLDKLSYVKILLILKRSFCIVLFESANIIFLHFVKNQF